MRKITITSGFLSLLLGIAVPALTSCSGSTDEAKTQQHTTADTTNEDWETIHAAYDVPETFKSSFNQTTKHYLALKDALVASNAAEAQKHADAMVASLNKTDAGALEGGAEQKWNSVAGPLRSGATKIAGTSDLGVQRGAFTALSDNMIIATEAFGAGTTVYRQYCPMANKNAGGSWISSNKQIRNPYYGDAMLECGEVQASIQDRK